jgi:hypothetical protein
MQALDVPFYEATITAYDSMGNLIGTVSETVTPSVDDPNYTIPPLGARSTATPIKAVVLAITGETSFAVGSISVGLSKSGQPTRSSLAYCTTFLNTLLGLP